MNTWSKGWAAVVLCTIAMLSGEAGAAMAQVPLTGSSASVAPNLMFTLDDSGSMEFECVPEALCYVPPGPAGEHEVVIDAIPWHSGGAYRSTAIATYSNDVLLARRIRSSAINPLYYNPAMRYRPWLKANGSRHAEYRIEEAPTDPNNLATRANLAAWQTINAKWAKALVSDVYNQTPTDESIWPAQYYQLNPGKAGDSISDFTQVYIWDGRDSYPKAIDRTDCAGSICTYREEAQNFSNWFTYPIRAGASWCLWGRANCSKAAMDPARVSKVSMGCGIGCPWVAIPVRQRTASDMAPTLQRTTHRS